MSIQTLAAITTTSVLILQCCLLIMVNVMWIFSYSHIDIWSHYIYNTLNYIQFDITYIFTYSLSYSKLACNAEGSKNSHQWKHLLQNTRFELYFKDNGVQHLHATHFLRSTSCCVYYWINHGTRWRGIRNTIWSCQTEKPLWERTGTV